MSVFVVILGHTLSPLLARIPFTSAFRNAPQGAGVFFVISGFLITHLLLKELKQTGQIDLKRFYLRRTFRIFPPFYAYLLCMLVLACTHLVFIPLPAFIAAATYTWNYLPYRGNIWLLGHCWSLALEEQFYLLWPACIAFLGRRTSLKIAIAILLLSPASRVITYYAWPAMRVHTRTMLHTHLDTIMMGSLLALLIDMRLWERARSLALSPAAPFLSLGFLMAIDGPAEHRWRGAYLLPFGYSLENIAYAALLLYVVSRHQSWLGKVLNNRVLRHFGVISYSLYLWQEPFTGRYTRWVPFNFVLIAACAELSYFLVERPSFRLRDRIEQRLWPKVPRVHTPAA